MVSNHAAPVVFLGAVCRSTVRSLAAGGHADGYGAAGGHPLCAGSLPLLAIQKKVLTLCKRHPKVPLTECYILTNTKFTN